MLKLTSEEKAKNAIKWIEALPHHKQAPKGKREQLGCPEQGFCCLGVGAFVLKVEDYRPTKGISFELAEAVGLRGTIGVLREGEVLVKFYGERSLTLINDLTNAGFKRIARLMKNKPHWMFEADVAELIAKHYSKENK